MLLTSPNIECELCLVFLSIYFQNIRTEIIIAKSRYANILAKTVFGKKLGFSRANGYAVTNAVRTQAIIFVSAILVLYCPFDILSV